jgi:hypothetical protein
VNRGLKGREKIGIISKYRIKGLKVARKEALRILTKLSPKNCKK